MSPSASPNRAVLERIARRLGPLLDEVVFVGGQVAELLVTDRAAVRIRSTDDVDIVVPVLTRSAYHRFGSRLRALGFREDTSPGAPICRWRDPEGGLLDAMPVEGAVLGFSNRWYGEVLRTALVVELEPGLVLRVASAPAFLASKWEAFDERGCGTYYGSADVEDIVTVVAGREELAQDMAGASLELRHWLGARTATFLRQDEAADVIAGALPDAWGAPTTVAEVRKRFEALVGR